MLCPTCGNEIEAGGTVCRYCGSPLHGDPELPRRPGILRRVVNLELGRPLVETALRRLQSQIEQARTERVKVLTVIHGYGSSGTGGSIRIESRKVLAYLAQRGDIRTMIPGEQFTRREGAGKALVRRFPDLTQLCAADFRNPGITVVEL